jgi:hypothetical protein
VHSEPLPARTRRYAAARGLLHRQCRRNTHRRPHGHGQRFSVAHHQTSLRRNTALQQHPRAGQEGVKSGVRLSQTRSRSTWATNRPGETSDTTRVISTAIAHQPHGVAVALAEMADQGERRKCLLDLRARRILATGVAPTIAWRSLSGGTGSRWPVLVRSTSSELSQSPSTAHWPSSFCR